MTVTAAGAGPAAATRHRGLRRVPGAAWLVALITLANALAWGLVVPPFHVPDEPAHVFYAQYLGETGKLPRLSEDADWYAEDEFSVIAAERFYEVVGESRNRPPADVDAEAALRVAQRPGLDRVGVGDASSATTNPPLYYVPQALVYRLGHGLDWTSRLMLMRLLSALMAGATALCIFLFARELLPRTPLAWTVAGLAAGLQPMFAMISAGVNNDAGLYLASAALFLAVARMLRRGLTVGRAVAVGLLLGAGILVKTQVIAFAPGVGLALLVAAWRGREARAAWRPLAAGVGAGLVPLAIYGVLGATVWSRPIVDRVGQVTSGGAGTARPWLLAEQVSYLWQLYLPRAPNLTDNLPGVPPYDLWFRGLVGQFGWLDYRFPEWVYPLAAGIWIVVATLAAARLWQCRSAAGRWLPEVAIFAVMAAGLAAAIAVAGYRDFVATGPGFVQARYLLPLLPLYALFPALAVRALGARRAPIVAVVLIAGVLAHGLFAQLQTLARFYG